MFMYVYVCMYVTLINKRSWTQKSKGEVLEELEGGGGVKLCKYKILQFQIKMSYKLT